MIFLSFFFGFFFGFVFYFIIDSIQGENDRRR